MSNKKFFFATTGLISGVVAFSTSPKKNVQPNIIIILADDLGYGDVSSYGSTTISTPNIDRLANGGVRFTNGYATSATSTPSRYALFTGMYPWKNKDAKILPGDAPLLINTNQPTLPKTMQSAGYKTAAIGKWHLGMGNGNPNWNETIKPGANEVGFDFSCLIAATPDRVPTVYVENGNVIGIEKSDPLQVNYKKNFEGEPTALTNPEMLKMQWSHGHNQSIVNGIPRIGYQKGGKVANWEDENMADFLLAKVKTFVSDNQSNPFFLYYGLNEPHVPRTPHSRFVGVTGMGPRGDAIAELDWCVGELIAQLEKLGILDNTIIVFSSDNGPVLDDGYKDQAVELLGNHKPAGLLRGGKYSLFEGGVRVPFITYWHNTIKPTVSDAMVCHLDLFASFAKLLNQPIKSELDSKETLNAFMGKTKSAREELVIEAGGRLGFRKDNYALIPAFKGNKRNNTGNELGISNEFLLFNLTTDLGQEKNIAKEEPQKMDQLKKRFLEITKSYYSPNVIGE